MASYNKKESAEWGIACEQLTAKLRQDIDQGLQQMAARGFLSPTGDMQDMIVDLTHEVKRKLTETNGKIYQETRRNIYKLADMEQKVNVGLAKLDMEKYKAELEAAFEVKEGQSRFAIEQHRAQVEFLKANVDARQAAIIEEAAKVKDEMIYWKKLQINAERLSLAAEIALIDEKVRTAEMKMEIIPYLYEVIAAEQLLIVAEQQRAAALTIALEWEKKTAEIKLTMIPYYQDKAMARLQLAEATRIEAIDREAYERLGYDKLALRVQEESNKHLLRMAENEYEGYAYAYEKARAANHLAREKAHETLTRYQTDIKAKAIELEKNLKVDERGYRLDLQWFWKNYDLFHEILLYEFESGLQANESAATLQKMLIDGREQCKTIRAEAHKKLKEQFGNTEFIYVSGG